MLKIGIFFYSLEFHCLSLCAPYHKAAPEETKASFFGILFNPESVGGGGQRGGSVQVRVDLLSVCPQSDFTSRMFRPSPADDSGGGSEQVFRMDRMSVVDPYGGAWSLQGDLHAKYLRFTLSQLANNMPDNHLRYTLP